MGFVSAPGGLQRRDRRDIQSAGPEGRTALVPGKGMDTFAPMSEPVPISAVDDVHDLDLELTVNGEVRQQGNTSI